MLVGALFGIPLGVIAAVHQNGIADKLVLASSSIMSCIPNYCVGLVLILVFALKLRWFPPSGIGYGLKAYILPCVTIMIGSFSGLSRQMRSSMLEVIRSDYVTSARAQGFSPRAVYYLHALPNALIPIITMMGTQFAAGLGGTMTDDELLKVEDLSVIYTAGKKIVRAVNGVSFEIKRGEALALVGESGCGKSTIAKAPLRILPDRGDKISMVFQDPMTALNPVKRILTQVSSVIRLHNPGMSKHDAQERAIRMLETVGITRDRVRDYPHQFSGGQQQRVVVIGLFGALPDMQSDGERLKPIEGIMPEPSDLPAGCKFHTRCPYATKACEEGPVPVVGLGGTHKCQCHNIEAVRAANRKEAAQ